jgi:hypothetical protein
MINLNAQIKYFSRGYPQQHGNQNNQNGSYLILIRDILSFPTTILHFKTEILIFKMSIFKINKF